MREIRALLAGVAHRPRRPRRGIPGIEPPDETGATFAENARLKALYYARATGLPAIADDSGLEIDALNGAPGIESARFGGADTSYPEKFRLIYDALRRAAPPESPARFVCAVALADGDAITVRDHAAPSKATSPRTQPARAASATTRFSSTRRTAARSPRSPRNRRMP